MMTFSEYWKKKSQKRRKSWAAKAKRFAEQHTQMEEIRKEVYLPLDFGANFSFEDYKPEHFIKSNPLVCWQNMNFRFSEEGLRAALEAEGADMNSFKMGVNRQSLKGKELSQPKNRWEAYSYLPNKVFDYDKMYRSWLQRIYEICTDVETVSLSYRQILQSRRTRQRRLSEKRCRRQVLSRNRIRRTCVRVNDRRTRANADPSHSWHQGR